MLLLLAADSASSGERDEEVEEEMIDWRSILRPEELPELVGPLEDKGDHEDQEELN